MLQCVAQRRHGSATFKAWLEQDQPHFSALSSHEGLELAWATHGCLRYRIGVKEYELKQGQVILVPEGAEHRSWLSAGGEACAVHLRSEALAAARETLGARLYAAGFQPSIVHAPALVTRLGTMLHELEAPRRDGLIGLAIEELALLGLESSARERAGDWRLTRAIALMVSQWNEPLDVTALARAAGLSRAYFTRRFQARLKTSPYRFILELRLSEAGRRLAAGASVTEAALACGFPDLSRFGRQFKTRYGHLPSQHRRPAASTQPA